MNNSKCVSAIGAVCEIYNRPPMSESAALAYFRASGYSDEELFIQALFDWIKHKKVFPLPVDIAQIATESVAVA